MILILESTSRFLILENTNNFLLLGNEFLTLKKSNMKKLFSNIRKN